MLSCSRTRPICRSRFRAGAVSTSPATILWPWRACCSSPRTRRPSVRSQWRHRRAAPSRSTMCSAVSPTTFSARELLIQGRKEALTPVTALSPRIREQLDVLVDLGNTRNAWGHSLRRGDHAAVRGMPTGRVMPATRRRVASRSGVARWRLQRARGLPRRAQRQYVATRLAAGNPAPPVRQPVTDVGAWPRMRIASIQPDQLRSSIPLAPPCSRRNPTPVRRSASTAWP